MDLTINFYFRDLEEKYQNCLKISSNEEIREDLKDINNQLYNYVNTVNRKEYSRTKEYMKLQMVEFISKNYLLKMNLHNVKNFKDAEKELELVLDNFPLKEFN